jgi:hypothetical protein
LLLLLGRSFDTRSARIACNILSSSSMAASIAACLLVDFVFGQCLHLEVALVRIFTLK